jgi:chemosensory pili system protein ChpA (sensor histidine kinase/response regulator)
VTSLLDQQGKVNKEIQQGLMRTGMVRFGSIVPGCAGWCGRRPRSWESERNCWSAAKTRKWTAVVLESMVAPLEHMLRNSLAHGIESPERAPPADKPEIGTITLACAGKGRNWCWN